MPGLIEVRGAFNKFAGFFVQELKIVINSKKFSMLFPFSLWGDWTIFMIADSNEQPQQELEYTLLKPDCHSWWICKCNLDVRTLYMNDMQSNTVLKFENMPHKRMECFKMLWEHLAWIKVSVFEWHNRFKESTESVRDEERCGRSKEINTPELIGQRVRVRVTMLRF